MESREEKRMAVFILGNGFDLAHGLETRYTDFLEACHKKELQSNIQKEKLQKNIWFNHFNEKQKEIGENWFNLEEEIYKVITKTRDTAKEEIEERKRQSLPSPVSQTQPKQDFYNFFKREYLLHYRYVPQGKDETSDERIAKNLYERTEEDSLRFFVDQFGEYLLEQLKNPDLTQKPKILDFLEKDILYNRHAFNQYFNKIRVVNFNYTNTFERLYGEYLKDKGIIDVMYYHIYGSLDKNNLVLGTQDLPDENDPFRIFTKECQSLHYETNKEYQKILKELRETNRDFIITFYIIGHSLDKADHKILNKILCYSGSEGNIGDINIYRYKDNESLEILKNIEKIILEYPIERVSFTPLETIIDDESAEEIK